MMDILINRLRAEVLALKPGASPCLTPCLTSAPSDPAADRRLALVAVREAARRCAVERHYAPATEAAPDPEASLNKPRKPFNEAGNGGKGVHGAGKSGKGEGKSGKSGKNQGKIQGKKGTTGKRGGKSASKGSKPHAVEESAAGADRKNGGAKKTERGVTLFISGLPVSAVMTGFKQAVATAFKPFGGARVKMGRNERGHTTGYCWVWVPSAAAADAAVAAWDGARLPGFTVGVAKEGRPPPYEVTAAGPLQVGAATDKRDMLFPDLPRSMRLSLRFDGVALFSVTDAPTADRIADILGTVVGGAAFVAAAAAVAAAEEEEEEEEKKKEEKKKKKEEKAAAAVVPARVGVVDAFACVGGSALALARRPDVFRCVVAVELDAGRADMLAHNLAAALDLSRGGAQAAQAPAAAAAAVAAAPAAATTAAPSAPGALDAPPPRLADRAGSEATEVSGNAAEALAHYTNSLALDPNNAAARNNRAQCRLQRGDFSGAEEDCDCVLLAEPRNTKALFQRAAAREALGRLRAARADLHAALALEPDNPATHAALERVAAGAAVEAVAGAEAVAAEAVAGAEAAAAAAAEAATVAGDGRCEVGVVAGDALAVLLGPPPHAVVCLGAAAPHGARAWGGQRLGGCGCEVAFLDPPWGGTAYGGAGVVADLALDAPDDAEDDDDVGDDEGDEGRGGGQPTGSGNGRGSLGLNGLVLELARRAAAGRGPCQLAALRLPTNYDVDGLADSLVAPGAVRCADPRERPLPFLLKLGPKALLFLACFPAPPLPATTSAAVAGGAPPWDPKHLGFGLATLDGVIAALNAKEKGAWRGEHSPKFFDYDAGRWIRLRDWKGTR